MPLESSQAQPSFLHHVCIDNNGNYIANSTYHAILNALLFNLTSDTVIGYGFYNFSYGQNSDKVNVIGMCSRVEDMLSQIVASMISAFLPHPPLTLVIHLEAPYWKFQTKIRINGNLYL